ncbi:unnamed protein product [Larinioides sclopetarius]|uniref:Uncharacterized protein n=2 Tax=Larinioides sclopetarius TaxID=280406 RepID=A0AAV2BDH0_9ARAC
MYICAPIRMKNLFLVICARYSFLRNVL